DEHGGDEPGDPDGALDDLEGEGAVVAAEQVVLESGPVRDVVWDRLGTEREHHQRHPDEDGEDAEAGRQALEPGGETGSGGHWATPPSVRINCAEASPVTFRWLMPRRPRNVVS